MEEQTPTFTRTDFEIVKREVMYQGFCRLVLNQIRHKKFNGGWTGTFNREVMERPSAVGVLPYDPVLDQVILIEQFRAGVITHSKSPWLIEIIAGIYHENDDPIETIHHEAQEEGGIELLDLLLISEYFVSPGASNELFTLYCAPVNARNTGGIFGLEHESEDIRAFTVPAARAFQMLEEGKIQTSPAIMALQWLKLNHERIKKLWQK